MLSTDDKSLALKINLMQRIETQDAEIYKEIYEFFSCIRIKRMN